MYFFFYQILGASDYTCSIDGKCLIYNLIGIHSPTLKIDAFGLSMWKGINCFMVYLASAYVSVCFI